MATINISLPDQMYEDAKKALEERRYASISEFIRDALRKILYQDETITENGFPKWFEDRVLEAEKSPQKNDLVIETEEDLEKFFTDIHQRVEKRRNGKN